MKTKNKLVVRSVRECKKCYVSIKKRHIKGEKHIASKDFAEYLRNSDVSENGKFIMTDFCETDFMKFCYISKMRWYIRWDVQYLEVG